MGKPSRNAHRTVTQSARAKPPAAPRAVGVGKAGSADSVASPSIGDSVHVVGPEFRCPAIVTRVHAAAFGPLVIDAVVFPAPTPATACMTGRGSTELPFFGHLVALVGLVRGATLSHKTTARRGAGPCYWIWPTEAS